MIDDSVVQELVTCIRLIIPNEKIYSQMESKLTKSLLILLGSDC